MVTIIKLVMQLLWCAGLMSLPLFCVLHFDAVTPARSYLLTFLCGVAYSQTVEWVGALTVATIERLRR